MGRSLVEIECDIHALAKRDGNAAVVFKFDQPVDIETSGDGYWTRCIRFVKVTSVVVENRHSVNVYFDPASWNVKNDGLIYTDTGFLQRLQKLLRDRTGDSKWSTLDYTEAGMQGDDFVSLEF